MTNARALVALALAGALATTVVHAEELAVVGTGDGIPVLQAVGEAFTAQYPEMKVLVPPSINSSGRSLAASHALSSLTRRLTASS